MRCAFAIYERDNITFSVNMSYLIFRKSQTCCHIVSKKTLRIYETSQSTLLTEEQRQYLTNTVSAIYLTIYDILKMLNYNPMTLHRVCYQNSSQIHFL